MSTWLDSLLLLGVTTYVVLSSESVKPKNAENRQRTEQAQEPEDRVSPQPRVHSVTGDGACQFRSMAYCLYRNEACHSVLRQTICDYIMHHKNQYEGFFTDTSIDSYIEKMRKESTWGDNVTLNAFCDMTGRTVILDTDFQSDPLVVIGTGSNDPLHLQFRSEVHYNAIVEN